MNWTHFWQYRDAGAKSISAITTHGIFPGDAIYKLQQSGLFTEIICSDSHPRSRELIPNKILGDFLKIVPAAPIFARFLRQHPITA